MFRVMLIVSVSHKMRKGYIDLKLKFLKQKKNWNRPEKGLCFFVKLAGTKNN